jgi:tripartite-type tricarboxylate transporter receptor subunit TctC
MISTDFICCLTRPIVAMTLAMSAFAVALVQSYPTAHASEYPTRPIRLVVPYAPGGTADILARIVGKKLSDSWGQQVVVDNRAGAGGNIGSDIVAKASPDGYTMLMGTSGSNAVNPTLYTRMPYDAKRDLALVAMVASTANILVTHPQFQGTTVKDFIELAKAKPGKVTYGSAGVGSVLHLSGELLKTMTGVNIVHVPYKGTGPSITDLMGRQIDSVFANLPSVVPLVQSGKLKGIAVTTAQRAPALPNVPTMIEGGVSNYDVASWFGLFVPAKTSTSIATKLNLEVQRILKEPGTQEQLVGLGADPLFKSVGEANKYFHDEIEKWAKVVKASGAKAD